MTNFSWPILEPVDRLTAPFDGSRDIPRPRTPAGGYESIDWSQSPLARYYKLPGEPRPGTFTKRRRPHMKNR